MLIASVYVFLAVTFFTTFNGVVSYIFGSTENASLLQLIIFAIVLLFLQAYLLLRSTYHVIEFKNNSFSTNIAWFPIWFTSFIFSAAFSYTFYYNILSADAHGQRVINQQINQVIYNADEYLSSFSSIKKKMDDLSDYSNKKAIEEDKKGGTCGDWSPPGKGPRINYRLDEQKKFKKQAKNISSLYAKVQKEITLFKEKKQKYTNKKIKTIPELELELNQSVATLNTYNENHPVLKVFSKELSKHSGKKRKTTGINSDGSPIFCKDLHITKSIKEIKQKLKNLKIIPNIALFDHTNRKELQNRVIEVFLSPFQNSLSKQDNDFDTKDYIALALGFFIETLMFIISFILHSNTHYSTNHYGYVGEHFSSQDVSELQKLLNVDKKALTNVMLSAKKHQSGYFIIIDTATTFCPVIDTLDCRGLFTKILIAVPFNSLQKRLREMDPQYAEKIVNVYFSPNKIWTDYRMSLSHFKETA